MKIMTLDIFNYKKMNLNPFYKYGWMLKVESDVQMMLLCSFELSINL